MAEDIYIFLDNQTNQQRRRDFNLQRNPSDAIKRVYVQECPAQDTDGVYGRRFELPNM